MAIPEKLEIQKDNYTETISINGRTGIEEDVVCNFWHLDEETHNRFEYDDAETNATEIVRRYNGYTGQHDELQMYKSIDLAHQRVIAEQQIGIEQLRVQLAGCGVAAMQNTVETIKQRAKKDDYGWSASYQDVCNAVDREMKLRDKNFEKDKLIEQLVGACDIASSRLPWDSSAKKMCDDALAAAKEQTKQMKG